MGVRQRRFFPLYADFKTAVCEKGIKTHAEYDIRQENDPRLPSRPDLYYKERGWESWPALFSSEVAGQAATPTPTRARRGSKRAQ